MPENQLVSHRVRFCFTITSVRCFSGLFVGYSLVNGMEKTDKKGDRKIIRRHTNKWSNLMIIHFRSYSISSCANSGTKWWRQHISTCHKSLLRPLLRFFLYKLDSEATGTRIDSRKLLYQAWVQRQTLRNNKHTSCFHWMGNRKCKTTRTRGSGSLTMDGWRE